MDTAVVERLLDLLQGTCIQELTLEENGSVILIRRRAGQPAAPPTGDRPERTALAVPEEPSASAETFVRAHLVGVFHAIRPPVAAGDGVRPKEILGLIESMKLMNDILAQEGGEVAEVLVEEGQPVEYGQPLFRIRPAAGGAAS
ncbi:MAG: biotin/lipoyl-binding protein [Armatimonadetes bacterium]|nr:biotin/lipoyl-binding protein [Armatimonadota bacterium]